MFDLRYRGLRLIPSKTAMRELIKYGATLEDCKDILEQGYPAPRKRAKGTIEQWLDRGNKTSNTVVVKSYNYFYGEDVYLITHFGCFRRRK